VSVRTPHGLYDPATDHDACGVGLVAHIKGEKSRDIVTSGLQILDRLSHRAATGSDPETGDGAGILLQLPHRFFKRVGLELGFEMPRRRRYGVGQLFLPQDPEARAACETMIEEVVLAEEQLMVGWRDVPIDERQLGRVAREVLPVFRQVYIARHRCPPSAFERKLFIIRKLIENRVRRSGVDPDNRFHIASLSAETIVYKGLLLPRRLPAFYPDLGDDDMVSAIALVHSRFSTNTFPTWDLAQPFRLSCHNGEINTLRGNRNWLHARRRQLQSAYFGGTLERLYPIIVPGRSDSAQFDNMLELLYLGGRSLAHSMMMMIPEAWENHRDMEPELRDFYHYSSSLLEPWDGPAAIAFTDGLRVGATLDRNGLRPARYLITEDDLLVLASETGVVDVAADNIREKGRLQPGKMLLVDTEEGRIIDDAEIKAEVAHRWPYGKWLRRNVYDLDMEGGSYDGYNVPPFPEVAGPPRLEGDALRSEQLAFGYSDEDVRIVVEPMAATGKEPVWSMGFDTPLACLSDRAPTLFNYFHQLFAQVTNPAIDPIREALVMTLETSIGPDGNTFEETPEQCHKLRLDSPILGNEKLAKIAAIHEGVFEPVKLSTLYRHAVGLGEAVDSLCAAAETAVDEGYNILILSDRGVDAEHIPIPALLAVSAVHQHLVRAGSRMQIGLIAETGEAREVHDFALLLGYGAAAINPYVALDTAKELAATGALEGVDDPMVGKANYIEAVCSGLLKTMSKMGISTLQSYRGAQIFEAVGLDRDLVDRHFTGTPSRLAGVGLDELAIEAEARHARVVDPPPAPRTRLLPIGGVYQWRREGERHKWNPDTIAALQQAARTGDRGIFGRYTELIDREDHATSTLRGQLDFAVDGVDPVPLDEIEPVSEICKRFVTGAMSFGSISAEAHETLAIAMNRIGGRSNSGEGGEEAHRYEPDEPDENGRRDWRSSRIKQVASGRFGVTAHYLVNADDLQIKISQGAKPGEGGQLPGHKVDARIARVRHSTPGVGLISPPPHHDIYSIEDLAQLIYDLQTVNPSARVSVKLVSEVGVGTVAAGVAKAHAGAVIIAGASGGTGASPLSSIAHAGLPWELGVAESQQVLVENDLRGRIRLQADGGMRTPRDLAIATLLGAEEWGVATAALIVEGCIMLRKCHLNTCSVGIATQDPGLREKFAGDPDHLVAFFTMLAEGLREIMARLGFRTIAEMVGRVDRLRHAPSDHWKARRLDLSALIAEPRAPSRRARRFVEAVPWDLADHLDHAILDRLDDIERGDRVEMSLAVDNTKRAIGTMLSGEIARRRGAAGLVDDSVHLKLSGSAGQSLGAFATRGVTLVLEGDTNDYLGKGLSGGRIVVKPPAGCHFEPSENIIVGNTVLYGATGGGVFIAGIAGERFAVRNCGARAVVEGVGDHGCEYMTGGVVVVLGATGRNFAAGMSGGMAFVFDRDHTFRSRCNTEMVELEPLIDDQDVWLVAGLIRDHVEYTGSAHGARILEHWDHLASSWIKVMPVEYRRALRQRKTTGPIPVLAEESAWAR
jgi:glutamate synthase (NADPH/NADH) large chain